jgi:signal transduction histidine kinase/ActR/RegA family two-component response regulator
MNTLRKFIVNYLFSEEKPLGVRTVNVVVLVGCLWMIFIVTLRLFEMLFLGEMKPQVIIAVSAATVVYLVMHAIFHAMNAPVSVRGLATIVIVDITWPISFFSAGGIESGFAAAFTISLALIFYLTRGKALLLAIALHFAIIIGTYAIGFQYPELVTTYSAPHVLVDTMGAVIASGCAIGMIDMFQNRLYRQEHLKVEKESAEATRFANELERARDELLEQEQLLSVVNQTTQMFLNPVARNLDVMLKEALMRMGMTLGLDRIRICRREETDEGYEYRAHGYWAKEGFEHDFDTFDVKSYPSLRKWEACLQRNESLNGPLTSLSAEIPEPLRDRYIKSILIIPVFQQDEYWGFMTFVDCHVERVFPDTFVDILSSAAIMLVSAILLDQMDRQMQSALKSAIRASKAKSEFLSNMSHEIRTPMNAIIGMTSIARNTGELRQKDDALEKIDGASRHLLGVINDILDMSKLDAKKLDLSLVSFSFSDMLQRALDINEFSMESKNLTCKFTVDDRIPPVLIGDDQRLSQVVTNLLSNAVKFTPEGGRVSLRARLVDSNGEWYTLRTSISDTGIGISAEQQAQLFASFQQAESGTSRKYGGTGLGLAISKSIVELMDGRIWVESKPGEGSTFFFEISLQRGDEADLGVGDADDARNALALPEDLSDYEIMLAEDVEVNQEIVSAFLEDTGVGITMAKNGREAVEFFEAEPSRYALILMDIQMPEMDGLEATQKIRALKVPEARTVPIIAMTANVFREDVESCFASGMNDHIGKPITTDSLKAVLAKYLA